MAILIRNEQELINVIVPKLKEAVNYIVQKILEENQELIKTLIYESYTPVEYERTGEFKEAWNTSVKSQGRNIEGEFKYNPTNMSFGDNGQHSSLVNGTDVREYLANIIYEGLSGAIYQKGYAKNFERFSGELWTEKRDVWAQLNKWLSDSQFRKIFEEGMTKAGISWKKNTGKVNMVQNK